MFLEYQLNQEQLSAVKSSEKALLLLAGPGSGKTFTISQRLYYLIEKCKISPEKILVVTFTREAAVNMQYRFLQGADYSYPVLFGTFHSVFYSILRQSNYYSFKKILTDYDKKKISSDILRQSFSAYMGDGKEATTIVSEQLLKAVSFYKNTENAQETLLLLPEVLQNQFFDFYYVYNDYCRKKGYLDFDDMVLLCRDMLRASPQLLRKWQGRFSYILMDEFQDINPIQYEVIKLMTAKDTILFAVGDDDQSIYGFRGSNINCLWDYEREFGASKYYLSINYRSNQSIVKAANLVIGDNKARFQKNLYANPEKTEESKESIVLTSFENADYQYQYMVDQISNYCEEKSDTSIAILFRTNIAMQTCSAYLLQRDISFSMKEKVSSIYEHTVSKDLIAYLNIINFDSNKEAYERIINKPLRYINREALHGKADILTNMLDYYCSNQELPHFIDRIKAINLLTRQISFMRDKPLFLQVTYLLNQVGYRNYLIQQTQDSPTKQDEYLKIANYILEDVKHFSCMEDYESFIRQYNQAISKGDLQEKQMDSHKKKIQLMTAHASKGLEFDVVMIPDCNEGMYPYGKLLDEGAVEEERRIFYVAMTRAKSKLYLLYLEGNKHKMILPSRFLNPLFRSSLSSDT